MANRVVSHTGLAITAFADATNLTDNTYPAVLQGASGTQRTNVKEVYLGGQSGASAPTLMVLALDSQIGTGTATRGAGQTDAATDPATAALAAPVVTANSFATNKPQRSATLHLLNLSLNCFGGIVKWNPGTPDQAPAIVGNTASLGEMSLSAFTGGTPGSLGAHIVYETL